MSRGFEKFAVALPLVGVLTAIVVGLVALAALGLGATAWSIGLGVAAGSVFALTLVSMIVVVCVVELADVLRR